MAALGLRAASSRPASLALPRPLLGERCNIVFAAERRYRLSLALSPHPFLVRLHRTAAVSSSCERHVHARAQPLPPLARRPLAVGPRFSTYRSPALCGCRLGCEKGEREEMCWCSVTAHRSVCGGRLVYVYVTTNGAARGCTPIAASDIRAGGAYREGVSGANSNRNYEAPRAAAGGRRRRRAARPAARARRP